MNHRIIKNSMVINDYYKVYKSGGLIISQKMRLKTRFYEIEAEKPIVILNDEDAKDLGVFVSSRVKIKYNKHEITAIVDITETLVGEGEIGLLKDIHDLIKVEDDEFVEVESARRPASVDFIKKKLDGKTLNEYEIYSIIYDITNNNLSSIELSAFVTGGYINKYTVEEIVSLTTSMVKTGKQIDFGDDVVDKHCIGGVAGNRTTMVVVPIVAAAGLTIPKSSSRAITSPSGTADTMEVLSDVQFSIGEVKDIVTSTNACIIWGGAVNLAPADDKIIRVEYPLSLDAEGHLLSSVMAKKMAIGSDYVLIDIPVGKGSKIPQSMRARELASRFIEIGKRLGISVECLITDGSSPIGAGIGPALEARDVLNVLENRGPVDLMNKSLDLAGTLLELSKKVDKGKGRKVAEDILSSGKALAKMKEIIEAQGGDPNIGPEDVDVAEKQYIVTSKHKGKVRFIDNKSISAIARAAGAPRIKSSGIYMHVGVGDSVKLDDPLFTIYAADERKMNDSVKVNEKLIPIHVGSVISDIIT